MCPAQGLCFASCSRGFVLLSCISSSHILTYALLHARWLNLQCISHVATTALISSATSHEIKMGRGGDASRGVPQSSLAAVQRHGRHCSCYQSTCAAGGGDASAGRALCGEPSLASWPASDFSALVMPHLGVYLSMRTCNNRSLTLWWPFFFFRLQLQKGGIVHHSWQLMQGHIEAFHWCPTSRK